MKKKLSYSELSGVIGVKIDSNGCLIYVTGVVTKLSSLQTIIKTITGDERKFLHEQVFLIGDMDKALAYHFKLHQQMSK